MRRMTALFAFLLICNFAGADTKIMNDELVHATLNETFTLRVRQSVQLENEDFNMQILSVLEDSICPEDAQCIWAGAVVIHVNVKYGQTEEEYLLADSPGRESYNGIPRSVTTDHYQIQFLSMKRNSVLLNIAQSVDDQENDLQGVWRMPADGALLSEWHHKMGKIIKKSQVSVEENIKDEKIGTKVVGADVD